MNYKYNLQLFQGEKTEKATAKKKADARKKGQVVQTKDINAALVLITVFFAIQSFSDYFAKELYNFYYLSMDLAQNYEMAYETRNITNYLNHTLFTLLKIVLPLIGVALITGLTTTIMQVGFLFTTEPLKLKLSKINPFSGLKRLFSLKSIVEMVKSILKMLITIYITFSYLLGKSDLLVRMFDMSISGIIVTIWDVVYNIVVRSALMLLVLAILDYIYKKWENEKELRMSKQEVKDEYKQMEGDPLVKSQIKAKQREISMSRMMQDVPSADVIITNPTHYAVAVVYDREGAGAPKVIAKGRDLIAQNIKKVGTENNVPLVENKPLARALYSGVEIGEYIPPELYEAVAEVLAYVYSLKSG